MGKFDQVLLVSDYDNTLVYTQGLFDGTMPETKLCRKNYEQIKYFTENGGTFCIVSGRPWQLIAPMYHEIPANGPVGTGNGAAIYDPKTGTYLDTCLTERDALPYIRQVSEAFPHISLELMAANHKTYAYHISDIVRRHAEGAKYVYNEIASLEEVEFPLLKVLFEGTPEELSEVEAYIKAQPWADGYETVASAAFLLEFFKAGANKGKLVEKLAALLHKDMEHVYCIGDHHNDIPMLQICKEGFCPANAVDAVKEVATTVCHCTDGAVGEVIALLDARY